jgi:hypothetical protein
LRIGAKWQRAKANPLAGDGVTFVEPASRSTRVRRETALRSACRVVPVILVVLLAGTSTRAAEAAVHHARFDLVHGRAAGLKLGKATRRDAVRRLGSPKSVTPDQNTGTRRLLWSCGSGCTFEIRVRAGRVVTVWAYGNVVRRRIHTAAGSYLGLRERKAERREGGSFRDSCVRELSKSRGRITQSLSSSSGRVDGILMFTRNGGVPC